MTYAVHHTLGRQVSKRANDRVNTLSFFVCSGVAEDLEAREISEVAGKDRGSPVILLAKTKFTFFVSLSLNVRELSIRCYWNPFR